MGVLATIMTERPPRPRRHRHLPAAGAGLESRTIEHRPDRDHELLAAVATLMKVRTMLLALQLGVLLDPAATRADNAIGPARGFKILAGGILSVTPGSVRCMAATP
jgi:hypothetical protein